MRDEQLQVARDVEKYLRTVLAGSDGLLSKQRNRCDELRSIVQHYAVYASYCYGCGIRGEKTVKSFDTWMQATNDGTHTAKMGQS